MNKGKLFRIGFLNDEQILYIHSYKIGLIPIHHCVLVFIEYIIDSFYSYNQYAKKAICMYEKEANKAKLNWFHYVMGKNIQPHMRLTRRLVA